MSRPALRRLATRLRPAAPVTAEGAGVALVVVGIALVAPLWAPVLVGGVLLIGIGYALEGGA